MAKIVSIVTSDGTEYAIGKRIGNFIETPAGDGEGVTLMHLRYFLEVVVGEPELVEAMASFEGNDSLAASPSSSAPKRRTKRSKIEPEEKAVVMEKSDAVVAQTLKTIPPDPSIKHAYSIGPISTEPDLPEVLEELSEVLATTTKPEPEPEPEFVETEEMPANIQGSLDSLTEAEQVLQPAKPHFDTPVLAAVMDTLDAAGFKADKDLLIVAPDAESFVSRIADYSGADLQHVYQFQPYDNSLQVFPEVKQDKLYTHGKDTVLVIPPKTQAFNMANSCIQGTPKGGTVYFVYNTVTANLSGAFHDAYQKLITDKKVEQHTAGKDYVLEIIHC